MDIKYSQLTEVDDELLIELEEIGIKCFGSTKYNAQVLKEEFKNLGFFLIDLARVDGVVVGYKIGYQRRVGQFYSWLGGVDKPFRGQGIATQLMSNQHTKINEMGYKSVRTQTGNEFRAMLLLNIKSGFDIIGTFLNTKGNLRITLDKKIGK